MSKQVSNTIFSMSDFRTYIKAWAQARGRGEYRRISEKLSMHTTLVSQILGGQKCFTEEQASGLCSYMNLNVLEADYFLKLVQIERAGSEQLKKIYRRQLSEIKSRTEEIRSRVPESKKISESDRAIFYSSYHYGLIRLLTSIENFQIPTEIARHLNLSLSRVQQVLEFLVAKDLCEFKNGRYIRTEQNTHVEAQSALAIRHHQNWRAKSLELQEKLNTQDLAFTAPISISRKDFPKVRAVILEAISQISKIVEDSPPEEVAYLGMDFIEL